jgi:hypothetical protein
VEPVVRATRFEGDDTARRVQNLLEKMTEMTDSVQSGGEGARQRGSATKSARNPGV